MGQAFGRKRNATKRKPISIFVGFRHSALRQA